MNVQLNNYSPYARQITTLLTRELPTPTLNAEDKLEYLFDAFLGTKNTRYGPKPSPEGQVKIRGVLRRAIAANRPIPVLMPWGSRKPEMTKSIDVAEFYAISGLLRLIECVERVHQPGAEFRLRVEDESGLYLFENEHPDFAGFSKKYVDDFASLVDVLDPNDRISLWFEKDLFTFDQFKVEADSLFPIMHQYLLASENLNKELHEDLPSYHDLVLAGWRGPVSQGMREYYRDVYLKYHPGTDPNVQLARYFSSALARKRVGGTGNTGWEDSGFIKLYFSHPVPDSPIDDGTVYLRTMPEKFTRTHIAPWRAHGVVRLSDSDEITPKIVSWKDDVLVDTNLVTVSNDFGGSAVVRVDVLLGA